MRLPNLGSYGKSNRSGNEFASFSKIFARIRTSQVTNDSTVAKLTCMTSPCGYLPKLPPSLVPLFFQVIMRLTLRTLLAHLDKTLDAADDAAIVAKLRESEFAQNLVARIQQCVSSDKLAAPSPDSTSPADDPNRIGEYLDSVLLAEQVAEVERFCLESDARLAEVAACHQILSIALARPADVPPALRTRIYALSEQRGAMTTQNESIATPSLISNAATIASPPASRDSITEALTAEQASIANAIDLATAGIPPVGPDDSGVSDAPTRLRQSFPKPAEKPEPAMAGSRRFSAAEASEIFGRPSRVVPWLVSLALAASFLFVLSQVFKSLWQKPTSTEVAMQTDVPEKIGDSTNESNITSTPPAADNEKANDAPQVSEAIKDETDTPMVEPDPASPQTKGTEASTTEKMPDDQVSVEPTSEGAESEMPAPPATATPDAVMPDKASDASADAASDKTDAASTAVGVEVMKAEPLPPVDEVSDANAATPIQSTLLSEQSLFLTRQPDAATFLLSKTGEVIASGSELICPPLYRDKLNLGGAIELTMIGPAIAKVETTANEPVSLSLVTGRYLIGEVEPVVTPEPVEGANNPVIYRSAQGIVKLQFGEQNYQVKLNQPGAVVAVDVIHRRQVGADPEAADSILHIIELLCIQGEVSCTNHGKSIDLKTGQYASWIPSVDPTPVALPTVPDWISVPKEQPGSIEASARDGLLSLVRPEESIELSLLEAMKFRRAEVGALAAQTLAMIDRPSVYFGTDGIFNNVKQKAYWDRHFTTLVATLDRGPKSAELVRQAINQMDAAEANAIYRMLWLFSNEQLAAGSDALLVEALDSGNMVVRVLAAENLRAITGTTLGYRPENETSPRRAPDIKKWESRLRKGDIRWPEAPVKPAIVEAPAEPEKAPTAPASRAKPEPAVPSKPAIE